MFGGKQVETRLQLDRGRYPVGGLETGPNARGEFS
jgi:hypothetical protein